MWSGSASPRAVAGRAAAPSGRLQHRAQLVRAVGARRLVEPPDTAVGQHDGVGVAQAAGPVRALQERATGRGGEAAVRPAAGEPGALLPVLLRRGATVV